MTAEQVEAFCKEADIPQDKICGACRSRYGCVGGTYWACYGNHNGEWFRCYRPLDDGYRRIYLKVMGITEPPKVETEAGMQYLLFEM